MFRLNFFLFMYLFKSLSLHLSYWRLTQKQNMNYKYLFKIYLYFYENICLFSLVNTEAEPNALNTTLGYSMYIQGVWTNEFSIWYWYGYRVSRINSFSQYIVHTGCLDLIFSIRKIYIWKGILIEILNPILLTYRVPRIR